MLIQIAKNVALQYSSITAIEVEPSNKKLWFYIKGKDPIYTYYDTQEDMYKDYERLLSSINLAYKNGR